MTPDRSRIAAALPSYEIGDEVGRGAWGIVFSAEHRRLRRRVAVKELPPAFAADSGVQHRFASEARLLASFDHPHIVPIFDYVEQDGLCLLVMDLLPGGTVWDRISAERVVEETACGVVLATCTALEYAHSKGVLHRDIKPENLLFSASGSLKVTDFGIAKVIGGARTEMTRTGEVLGTPSYMAPEQATGAELTPATDVYAVGTLLYELLAGRLPFVDDGNMITLLYRHVHEAPTPLLEVAPSVPAGIADATMRALVPDPGDRQPSATDLGIAIAEAATAAWGPGWIARAGFDVMASGQIAARLSGRHRSQVSELLSPPARDEEPSDSPPTLISPSSANRSAPTTPSPPAPTEPAARSASYPPPPGPDEPPGVGPPPGAAPRPRRWRRRPIALVAAAIGLAAVIAVVAAVLSTGSSGKPRTPAAAGAQATTAPSLGKLVFQDSFANPRSGWAPDAGQDGTGSAAYVSGGYQVTALKPLPPLNTFSVASPYANKLPAMAVTVDSTLVTATPADGAGVRCDVNGRNAVRYSFEVHADGSWVVFRLGGPGQAVIAQGTSAAVRTGNATNTVTGQCSQLAGGTTRLVMTVNGVTLSNADDSPGPGVVGWHAGLVVYRSQASPGTVARFTNFRTFNTSTS